MERFTRIISIEGNYAKNTIGETFYITEDLFPFSIPSVISYDPKLKSSIIRSEIMEDDGEEVFYTIIVTHAQNAFNSTEQVEEYRRRKWNEQFVMTNYSAIVPQSVIENLMESI